MAATTKPSISYGGGQLAVKQQADFVTFNATTMSDLRFNSIDSYPTNEVDVLPQSQYGHENDADFLAEGVLVEKAKDSALQITMPICRNATDSTQPILMTMLESGGWSVQGAGTETTIDVYSSATGFTLVDDIFGADKGLCAILVELNDGSYYPALLHNYTSATKTCTLEMGLPSASQAGKAIQPMYTAHPMIGPVSAAKALSFRLRDQAQSFDYWSCGLASISDIELTTESEWTMQLTFHVAKVEQESNAMSTETFVSKLGENTVIGAEVGFATANSSGEIVNTQMIVNKIKFSIPYTTTIRPGFGSSTGVLNDAQGYMAVRPAQTGHDSQVQVEITSTFDTDFFTAFTARTNKYIHCVRSTTDLTVPAIAIWVPTAFAISEPVTQIKDEEADWITCMQTFGATSPRLDPTDLTDPSKPGNREIIIGISGYDTP